MTIWRCASCGAELTEVEMTQHFFASVEGIADVCLCGGAMKPVPSPVYAIRYQKLIGANLTRRTAHTRAYPHYTSF